MEAYYSDTNAGLHYDLNLNLDPQRRFIAVTGSLAYHAPISRQERARFYLHRQFNINRIEGRRVLGYEFNTDPGAAPDGLHMAGVLDVYFNPPLRAGDTALIQFDYHGEITDWPVESANLISPDWVELGMYLPWFPHQFPGGPADLTFTLKASAPAGYQVSSFGQYDLQEGKFFYNWNHPTGDIVVAAGRNLRQRVFESEANRVFLSSTTFSDAAAAQLGEDLLWTLERFSGWFGPTRPSDFTLIESPRPYGGGYARRGLVVLGGLHERDYLDQREAYLRYLAHETAHAWWWEAPKVGWETWLNESFAEYSALMAIRERFGVETYERFLDRKRERAAGLPPLWGYEPDGQASQQANERIRYDLGPLRLHELSERIGHRRFLDFCRARLWSGVTETGHLIDLLGEVENPETADWFKNTLQS